MNAAPPVGVLVGASEVRVGTGFAAALMVNARAFEVPPPGAGFTTVTCALPWVPMSVAGIAAGSCPVFTNVVAVNVWVPPAKTNLPVQRTEKLLLPSPPPGLPVPQL